MDTDTWTLVTFIFTRFQHWGSTQNREGIQKWSFDRNITSSEIKVMSTPKDILVIHGQACIDIFILLDYWREMFTCSSVEVYGYVQSEDVRGKCAHL